MENYKNENLKFKGEISILDITNGKENAKEIAKVDNMIMDAGRAWVLGLLRGTVSGEYLEYIAVGSDNTSVTPADMTLYNELAREGASSTLPVSNKVVFEAVFGAGVATGTWQEVGIFTDSPGGTMFNRAVYSPVTKTALQALMVKWSVTLL